MLTPAQARPQSTEKGTASKTSQRYPFIPKKSIDTEIWTLFLKMSATESWPRRPRSTVGALEVVVVGGGVDVALVAQVLDRVVHVVAAHATSDLDGPTCTFRKWKHYHCLISKASQNKLCLIKVEIIFWLVLHFWAGADLLSSCWLSGVFGTIFGFLHFFFLWGGGCYYRPFYFGALLRRVAFYIQSLFFMSLCVLSHHPNYDKTSLSKFLSQMNQHYWLQWHLGITSLVSSTAWPDCRKS